MDLFSRSWAALRTAVAELPDEDFARPSGCTGWLVRDLVCHLVIDAQDVLITLVTPATGEPTHNAVTYWNVTGTPPTGDDPLDALTVRLAAAYEEPKLLKFHLDDVGSAAGRAAELADPEQRVGTQDMVLTAGDYLSAYVLEWTLHHLDPDRAPPGRAATARREPRPLPRHAGGDRRGALPRVVVRPGRPPRRHGPPPADRRRTRPAGPAGRGTPVRDRLSGPGRTAPQGRLRQEAGRGAVGSRDASAGRLPAPHRG